VKTAFILLFLRYADASDVVMSNDIMILRGYNLSTAYIISVSTLIEYSGLIIKSLQLSATENCVTSDFFVFAGRGDAEPIDPNWGHSEIPEIFSNSMMKKKFSVTCHCWTSKE
jgi:hypothetical protein